MNDSKPTNELVAVEEPLEILMEYGPEQDRISDQLAVTMRTPGNDLELVAGFLAAEGIVSAPEDILGIRHCQGQNQDSQGNTVKVQLQQSVEFDKLNHLRHFYINSSCGVCGKANIDAIVESCKTTSFGSGPKISSKFIKSMPSILKENQLVFNRTGGLHAACLFDTDGRVLCLSEDVGRHNAMDKVLGTSFMAGKWPLTEFILLLSGRVSFELVQKSCRSGIKFIAAIGAPSSLAVELAKKTDITLLGFVSAERYNVYHGSSRIKDVVNSSGE